MCAEVSAALHQQGATPDLSVNLMRCWLHVYTDTKRNVRAALRAGSAPPLSTGQLMSSQRLQR